MSPKPYQIKDLRARHQLTQQQLADSLYDISFRSVETWEQGTRNCPGIVWWAMCLTWDNVDIYNEEI